MTDCERYAAAIPWAANGTLGLQETAELEQHLADCAACGQLLQQARLQLEHAVRVTGSDVHVPAALLVCFVERRDRLEDETTGWIVDHLERCADCRSEERLVRDAGVQSEEGQEDSWKRWFAAFLHPAPALAYLLLLVIAVPWLWYDGVGRGAPAILDTPLILDAPASPLTTERVARGEEAAEPLPTRATGGPQRVDLDLEWTGDDLASVGTLRIELRHEEALLQRVTRIPSELVAFPGGLRVTLWIDYSGAKADGVYEWTVQAEEPGDPLDGQILFRRRIRVVP